MTINQTRPIALLLGLSLLPFLTFAGFGVFASGTEADIPPIGATFEDDQTLRFLQPYRTWTRLNEQPLVLRFEEAALGG